jgi:hypothetical protein
VVVNLGVVAAAGDSGQWRRWRRCDGGAEEDDGDSLTTTTTLAITATLLVTTDGQAEDDRQ